MKYNLSEFEATVAEAQGLLKLIGESWETQVQEHQNSNQAAAVIGIQSLRFQVSAKLQACCDAAHREIVALGAQLAEARRQIPGGADGTAKN